MSITDRRIQICYVPFSFTFIARFQDLEGKIPDEEAQSLLHSLKDIRLPNAISSKNIFKYTIPWRKGGLDMSDNEHTQYIETFTSDFKNKWMDLVDISLEKR